MPDCEQLPAAKRLLLLPLLGYASSCRSSLYYFAPVRVLVTANTMTGVAAGRLHFASKFHSLYMTSVCRCRFSRQISLCSRAWSPAARGWAFYLRSSTARQEPNWKP